MMIFVYVMALFFADWINRIKLNIQSPTKESRVPKLQKLNASYDHLAQNGDFMPSIGSIHILHVNTFYKEG